MTPPLQVKGYFCIRPCFSRFDLRKAFGLPLYAFLLTSKVFFTTYFKKCIVQYLMNSIYYAFPDKNLVA